MVTEPKHLNRSKTKAPSNEKVLAIKHFRLGAQSKGNRKSSARFVAEAIRSAQAIAPAQKDFTIIVMGGTVDGKHFLLEKNCPTGAAGFDPIEAGIQKIETLKKEEGGSWTGAELFRKFGLSPQTLHFRRKKKRMIYWRDAADDFHYPKWQFTPAGKILGGVEQTFAILASDDEWGIIGYFLSPRLQLKNSRPLDLLREGRIEELLEHARTHAEEDTW